MLNLQIFFFFSRGFLLRRQAMDKALADACSRMEQSGAGLGQAQGEIAVQVQKMQTLILTLRDTLQTCAAGGKWREWNGFGGEGGSKHKTGSRRRALDACMGLCAVPKACRIRNGHCHS